MHTRERKHKANAFRAVVFDFGGVIEFSLGVNILQVVAEAINVPVNDFKEEYFKHNHLSNVHNTPWEEMLVNVIEHFTDSNELKAKALDSVRICESKKEINHELLSLFPTLKANGYKVAIFSNATSQLRIELEKLGIADLVDEVVISGEIGFQKPDKEAFQILFERLHVSPEEVIFVDDAQKSLEKAKEIGYTPILFTSNEQLTNDLRKLRILP